MEEIKTLGEEQGEEGAESRELVRGELLGPGKEGIREREGEEKKKERKRKRKRKKKEKKRKEKKEKKRRKNTHSQHYSSCLPSSPLTKATKKWSHFLPTSSPLFSSLSLPPLLLG